MLVRAVVFIVISCIIWWRYWYGNKRNLLHIPGAPRRSFFQTIFKTKEKDDASKHHVNITALRKQYGPVFAIEEAMHAVLVLCDFPSIYQALVQKGKSFGGRQSTFRHREGFGHTGILQSYKPDVKWKLLRKVAQKHLRQFGNGMSRLETMISEVAGDMFIAFSESCEKAFDPKQAVFDTALNSISFLITGERTHSGDPLVEMMREYESLFLKTTAVLTPRTFQLLDYFPFLKYLGFDKFGPYQRLVHLQTDIWENVRERNQTKPDTKSIYKVFEEHLSNGDHRLEEFDAQMTSLSLLFAGVTTTSTTFVAAINLLAHRPDIQDELSIEIEKVTEETGHSPNLNDRPNMPYSRAVLFELLRYTSVAPLSVRHRVTETTTMKGYEIPQDTNVIINLWALHHDEEFWAVPYEFRPGRYLDTAGNLVAADHPNRTHLMPFGAGTRVCVGESLALARLFLWIIGLVTKFQVSPGIGNEKNSTDARNYRYQGTLVPAPYKVIFTPRK